VELSGHFYTLAPDVHWIGGRLDRNTSLEREGFSRLLGNEPCS
jgi:hypothetical protein